MTMNSKSFVELDWSYTSVVKLGDGKLKKVEQKGTIVVHTEEGNQKFIHDVLYVPSLSQNFLVLVNCLEKVILYTLMMVCVLCMVRKTN